MNTVLSDLGRATKRGIKKCYKCGVYNGTRAMFCKNKQCDAVFKDSAEKRKTNLDAVKLITGNTRQVYSVRVRDRGPDYRGFVQLPLLQSKNENHDSVMISEVALCFVDSCQRLFDDSILKCHEAEKSTICSVCVHIESSFKSLNVAVPLDFKRCVLNSLSVDDQTKEKLWMLANETHGPLVQRVSKTVMAVKCQVTPKHPLGFLHFSFSISKGKEAFDKYYCSCTEFKVQSPLRDETERRRCLHYYACICAFASDTRFFEEFSAFIAYELPLTLLIDLDSEVLDSVTKQQMSHISPSHAFLDFPVMPDDSQNIEVTILPNALDYASENCSSFNDDFSLNLPFTIVPVKKARVARIAPKVQNITPKTATNKLGKKASRKNPSRKHVANNNKVSASEKETSLHFINWLSSVTERINQTMHYESSGSPDALVFHIPAAFFELLKQRISLGSSRTRLPNTTHSFARKDLTPFRTLCKYSWHINNIFHLKQIFETPLVSLQVSKSYVRNKNGDCTVFSDEGSRQEKLCTSYVRIKPLQHSTFLKVGCTSVDQTEPTPFVIEWIPNILPVTEFGELRLQFQFGHQDNSGI